MPAHVGIFLAITGGALGQLLMKSGLQAISLTDLHSVYYHVSHQPLPCFMIASGIASYILSMAVWVHTLKNHPLNQAIPYLSLSYVLVCVLATIWPGIEEHMTLQKSVGVALIIVGVWYTQSPGASEDSSNIDAPTIPENELTSNATINSVTSSTKPSVSKHPR